MKSQTPLDGAKPPLHEAKQLREDQRSIDKIYGKF